MHILIVGATSGIARAIARRFGHLPGCRFTLTARNASSLEADVRDLQLRSGGNAKARQLDLADEDSILQFLAGSSDVPDIVIVAAGAMATQQVAQRDPALLREMVDVNYTGPAILLEKLAERMAERGSGTIIGISSVAGDRGRATNYLYGASKAAFSTYLSGLRNRLFDIGVHVITILPGFVRTPMTEGMDLPGKLVAEPEQVAEDVFSAWEKKRDVVYTRWFWRWIMLIIRTLPEWIFKRTHL